MKNQIKPCCKPGCVGLGKWKAVVSVKTPDNDRAFEFEFQYLFCDTHKDETSIKDIVGPKNMKQLQSLFKSKSIYPPKIEHMTLKWELAILPIFDSNGLPISHTVFNKGFKKE